MMGRQARLVPAAMPRRTASTNDARTVAEASACWRSGAAGTDLRERSAVTNAGRAINAARATGAARAARAAGAARAARIARDKGISGTAGAEAADENK